MTGTSSACYEQIDHTGDVGIRVYGNTLKELFINAAYGMFDLMVEMDGVGKDTVEESDIAADNVDELLVNWLSELNYLFITDQVAFTRFDITRLNENELTAAVTGGKINPRKNIIKNEIKAVTYHDIMVKKMKDRWKAQVIFDI